MKRTSFYLFGKEEREKEGGWGYNTIFALVIRARIYRECSGIKWSGMLLSGAIALIHRKTLTCLVFQTCLSFSFSLHFTCKVLSALELYF